MLDAQQSPDFLLWLWLVISGMAISLAIAIRRVAEQRAIRSARSNRAGRAGRLLGARLPRSSSGSTPVKEPTSLSEQANGLISSRGARVRAEELTSDVQLIGNARGGRVSGDFSARMRQAGGKPIEVRVWDLSAGGFCADWPHKMQCGDRVWLMVDGTASQAALVAWTQEFVVGCKFENRVHGAVLNTIVQRAGGGLN